MFNQAKLSTLGRVGTQLNCRAILSFVLAAMVAIPLSVTGATGGAVGGSAVSPFSISLPPKPPLFGLHRETVTDLEVKVLGGYITVKRTWDKGIWTINRRWDRIKITRSTTTSSNSYDELSAFILNRNGTLFNYQGSGVYVDEIDPNYTFTRTETGYRWKDRQGNWIDYNGEGYMQAYGDANNVAVRVTYDENNQLTGVFDHHNKQILWYLYADNNLTIRDYANREVKYVYEGESLTKVIDVRAKTWLYSYAEGNLKTKTDPLGRVTTIDYNANKSVASTTDPAGNVTAYKYEYDKTKKEFYKQEKSPAGKIIEIWLDAKGDLIRKDVNGGTILSMRKDGERKRTDTDASGNETVIDYDEWRNPLVKTYADGSSESWMYDLHNNRVIEHVNENGVVTKNEYGAKGNLTKKIEAVGKPEQRTTRYSYDAYGQLLEKAVSDAKGEVVVGKYGYDEFGNQTSRTDGEGHTITTTHDVMGEILTWTNALEKTWTYTFDNAGNRLTKKDPLGRVVSYEYDAVGNRVKVSESGGRVTEYRYDHANRLVTTIDALKQSSTIEYHSDGLPVKMVDETSLATLIVYDLSGRITSFNDAAGNTTKFTYDDASERPVAITFPTYQQVLTYDKRNFLVVTTELLPSGERQVTKNTYDGVGNEVAVLDTAGRTTSYVYDALGRQVQSIDALDQSTYYQYDARDNLIAVTDANGGTTTYSYLKNDWQQSETRPLGGVIRYGYDSAGNLTSMTDAAGRKSTYSYDVVGREIAQQHFIKEADTSPEQSVSFSYDETDNFTGYADGTTSATYSHDLLGRVTHSSVNFGAFTKSFGYQYNAAGNKSRFSDAAGNNVDYGYDAGGYLNAITIPGVGTLTLNNYNWELPTQLTLPGGGSRELGYDALMRPTAMQGKDSAGTPLSSVGYEYDAAGNIIKKVSEHGEYRYGYDTLDRLTSVDNPSLNDEAYSYDAVGNRLSDNNQPGEWGYNLDNQLKQSGESTSYDYDASGSLSTRIKAGVIRSYQYNAKNRLVEVKESDATIGQYRFDPFGRRISKTVNGKTTWFLYSEEGLVGEYDESGNVIRQYGWWPDGTWGTDPVYLQTNSQTYFYHNDHLGTPQKLVSASGAVVWESQYEAFGLAHPVIQNVDNPLRFPGQYYDSETDTHYNYFRGYDPYVGRYTQEDPIGLDGGVNTYVYTEDNPIRYMDMYGLSKTGGKQANKSKPMNVGGYNKNSSAGDVQDAIDDAKRKGMSQKHIRALKGLLKVVKRAGLPGFLIGVIVGQLLPETECPT